MTTLRRTPWPLMTAIAVLATAPAAGAAVVTQKRVGPLELLSASEAAVVKFAGEPAHRATNKNANSFGDTLRALGYGACKRPDPYTCETLFELRVLSNGYTVLTAFGTTSREYRTARGTRPGTTISAMREREEGERIDRCRGGWTLGTIQLLQRGRRVANLAVTRSRHFSSNFLC